MKEKLTIRMARAKTEMNITQMAEALGVNRNSYSDYEDYKTPMRIDTAIKFSQITDTSLDDLIFLKPNYTSSVVKSD